MLGEAVAQGIPDVGFSSAASRLRQIIFMCDHQFRSSDVLRLRGEPHGIRPGTNGMKGTSIYQPSVLMSDKHFSSPLSAHK
jgi:hypothetical protein